MSYLPAGEVTTPLYTATSATPLAILKSRHTARSRRFFGGAFTDAGQILTKETDAWTEVAFWFNTQKANPAVVYAITYDGENVYDGPFTRATSAPSAPVPAPAPPPTKPGTPAPTPWAPVLSSGAAKPPSKMSPWLLVGGGAAILLLFLLARRTS